MPSVATCGISLKTIRNCWDFCHFLRVGCRHLDHSGGPCVSDDCRFRIFRWSWQITERHRTRPARSWFLLPPLKFERRRAAESMRRRFEAAAPVPCPWGAPKLQIYFFGRPPLNAPIKRWTDSRNQSSVACHFHSIKIIFKKLIKMF